MSVHTNKSERITRLRHRYLKEVAVISIQRAKYYTESWKETEGSGLSVAERVAMAMKNVYEKIDFYVDPDDRIAGTWTENFLGVPIDIERGLFNDVLRIELKKRTMFLHILKDNIRFIFYMIKRYGLVSLIQSLNDTSAVGAAMPSIGTTTMDRRSVNPCMVKEEDKKTLLGELLPFWRGKNIADKLKKRLIEGKVFKGDMESFYASLPSTTSKKDIVLSLGAAMGVWQGHLILDHKTPLTKGLFAMREELKTKIKGGNHTEDELQFLRSQEIAVDGVITFAQRLSEYLKVAYKGESDPERREILNLMVKNTASAPLSPASNFREAVQSF